MGDLATSTTDLTDLLDTKNKWQQQEEDTSNSKHLRGQSSDPSSSHTSLTPPSPRLAYPTFSQDPHLRGLKHFTF